jgi:hypothetical protein
LDYPSNISNLKNNSKSRHFIDPPVISKRATNPKSKIENSKLFEGDYPLNAKRGILWDPSYMLF